MFLHGILDRQWMQAEFLSENRQILHIRALQIQPHGHALGAR